MKIENVLDRLDDITRALEYDFCELSLNVVFEPNRNLISDWDVKNLLPVPVKGDGIGNKSGIYFILSETNEILYIGKATAGNLHERIWGHLKTPLINTDGRRSFPKNNFINRGLPDEYVNKIKNGKARLAVIEVVPASHASLIEVYLHTLHLKREGCIPPLNKQIG